MATVLVQMAKLILLASLYVGWVDKPFFLADKVGNFYLFNLEAYYKCFIADILGVETHSHPYIEILSKSYLTKLRYQGKFMNAAGMRWRDRHCFDAVAAQVQIKIMRYQQ